MGDLNQEVLRASGLGKWVELSHGRLTILADVSFTLQSGDSMAIVGASGSGKSTLLSLLAGLDTPCAGQCVLAGHTLTAMDEDARAAVRARHVGFVFQNFQLLPNLTALENVMLPLELRGDIEVEPAARSILQQVGLGERLHHFPRQLSGGEQQRVALARAFVVQPSVLFADEPTGNLDTQTGAGIIDLMFELNHATGTTLVLVTHDEALAIRCNRHLRLVAGQVAA